MNGCVHELARLRHAELVAEAREHSRARLAMPRRAGSGGRSRRRTRLVLLCWIGVLCAALLLPGSLTAGHVAESRPVAGTGWAA